MEGRLENNNGKCFDKKRCGLIQIFQNFWSPFIPRLKPDDSKLFAWAGMCLQQTPSSLGWGPRGERGGSPGWLLLPSPPPEPQTSLSNHSWALLLPWDLLTVTHILPVVQGEASNQGTILETVNGAWKAPQAFQRLEKAQPTPGTHNSLAHPCTMENI